MNVAQSVKSFGSKPMDYRPGHEQKQVIRSGMQSNDNPLYNSKQYYGAQTTASRGNTAGGMFKDSSMQVLNQKSGF